MRFVPRVDDRALQRRLEADLFLEEVGALAELERHAIRSDPELRTHLASPAEDLSGDEVRCEVADDLAERHRSVDEVVLVAAVGIPLAIGVVLVDDEFLARRQVPVSGHHGSLKDRFGGSIEQDDVARVGALGGREFGMGVVDVVPRAVREDGVGELRLDLGRKGAEWSEAASIVAWLLVGEVPGERWSLARSGVGVTQGVDVARDQDRRRRDGIGLLDPPPHDAVLGLDPADLRQRHAGTLARQRRGPIVARTLRGTGRCRSVRWHVHPACPRRGT